MNHVSSLSFSFIETHDSRNKSKHVSLQQWINLLYFILFLFLSLLIGHMLGHNSFILWVSYYLYISNN